MEAVAQFLRETPLWILAGLFTGENIAICLGAVVLGEFLARFFAARPVAEAAPPLTATELFLAAQTVLLNAVVTFAGLLLWRANIIHFRAEIGLATVLDFLVLVLAMDVAMYFLHRLAHFPIFFRFIHRTHHRYDNPRPLTLFVMNPLEALSFGVLWLVLLSIYDATWLGMALYLAFNVLFGLLGHVGVEPFPDRWKSAPLLKYVSTSSFHAGHHHDDGHNFGFYTLIWDKIFGTLAPRYEEDFGRRTH